MDKKSQFALIEKLVEEGEKITSEGELCTEFYILEEGEAWVYINNEKLDEMTADKGIEFIGEIGALLGRKRCSTAIAQTRCRLIKVPAEALEKLLKNSPTIGVKLVRSLALKAATMYEKSQKK